MDTHADAERYGLNPHLLDQARNLTGSDLTEWGDQYDGAQYDAAQRVIAYCLLDPDQFEQAFGTPAAPTITDVIAAFIHAGELFARFGGFGAYEDALTRTDPLVADAWYRRLYYAEDAARTLTALAEKRARAGRTAAQPSAAA